MPSPHLANGGPMALAGLRPRRQNRPRSFSMYDTPALSPTLFAESLFQMDTKSSGIQVRPGTFEAGSPLSHPYLLAGTWESTSDINTSKSKSTGNFKAATTSHPPLTSIPPEHRAKSKISLRISPTNSEVERILAKPALLRTTPRRRPRASTIDSTSGLPKSSLPKATNSAGASDISTQARSAFYQAFAKSDSPPASALLLPPGQSRRPIPPMLFQERPTPKFDGGRSDFLQPPKKGISPTGVYSSSSSDASSSNLSIPQFYSNPKATASDNTLDTLKSVETMKTMDTMSAAIRSLAPAHTPTIDHLSPRLLKGGKRRSKDSKVTRPSPTVASVRGAGSAVSSPKVSSPDPSSTPMHQRRGAASKVPGGMAAKRTFTPASPRELSDAAPLTRIVSGTPFPTKKRHHIPAPLKLVAPASPRSRKAFRQSKASSLTIPLSPALSTVSTLANVMNKPRKPSEKELRRRRFMKLTRTLGEDIPPELLVNNCAGNQIRDSVVLDFERASKNKNRHTLAFTPEESTRLDTNFPLSAAFEFSGDYNKMSSAMTGSPPNVLKKQGSLRRKGADGVGIIVNEKVEVLRNALVLPIPEPLSPLIVEPAPYFENHPFRLVIEDVDSGDKNNPSSNNNNNNNNGGGPTRRLRNSVYSFQDDLPWMRASLALPVQFETPFIEYAVTVDEARLSPLDISDPRGVYRREKRQGWSGEWNQPHIQDVIEKLRQL